MKITYLLWGIGLYGGIRSVFECANRLIARGHEVNIVTHFGDEPDWFPLKAPVIKIPPYSEDFPESDVVIATYWPTAYEVDRLKVDKKFYYIQGKDTTFYTDSERIETIKNTFRLSLKPIVVSKWLGKYLKDELNLGSIIIPNGLNTNIFRLKNSRKLEQRNKTLNIVYVTTGYGYIKGVQHALTAFRMLKKRRKIFGIIKKGKIDFKIIFVTTEKHPPPGGRRSIDEFISNPTQEELVDIYNKGDIFVHSSLFEGFSMPPLEAMACGNAVVATDSGGVNEYCQHGHNCILLPPKDSKKLAQAIEQLIEDHDLRIKLAQHGLETAKRFNWEDCVDKLEKVFREG